MKNATRYCAGPAYYRMCSTDVYCSKQPAAVAPKGNHHPSFLRFWNWAEENCRCSQICGGAENVVKTETWQTFVNGLLGFITLGIYPLCYVGIVYTSGWVAHRYGQLYLHCSLIYFWVPSSCFCIVIRLSEGWNNPVFSGVCQSGGCIIHAGGGGGFTHWLTDRFDVQLTTTSGNIITQSIIFSFSIS